MFDNIAFVGGIHGVGKSTICKNICNDLGINYLSASEVLKWRQIKENYKDKKVLDIPFTQDKLILGLSGLVKTDQLYLLDGHFCLLDERNEIFNIPEDTFIKINPRSLNVIVGEINSIQERLNSRDGHNYSLLLLEQMQINEIEYAQNISKILNVAVKFGSQNDYSEIIENIKIALNL